MTAHAGMCDQLILLTAEGEEGPAEYVMEALDVLKANRIDHGIHCIHDPMVGNARTNDI